MSDDEVVKLVVGTSLVAHVVALLRTFRPRNRFTLLLSVNVAVSVSILAYQGQRLRYTFAPPVDLQMVAFIVAEAFVLAAAAWAFGGHRVPLVVSCLAFALHVCATIAAIPFMLTFSMTRLI